MTNSEYAIELKNVGICFRLYKEKIFSLKESAILTARRLGQLAIGQVVEPGYRELWAIRNLNLSVRKGASLGIVGRNGSGKSTALKTISGVIFPTEGELWVRGRVSALVELGAGFEPELTGRENIFFGAAVAGLSRKETEKKVDSIVDFSELGEFIDVPIKNYSSGMYARLGFALATDVNPDVLIIDEILAVGDRAFQDKCLDRMKAFKARNKTILFVSHDASVTRDFCNEVIELENGIIVDTQSKATGLGNRW